MATTPSGLKSVVNDDGGDSQDREARVRRRILTVAGEIFERRGLQTATMDDIAGTKVA